MSARSLVLPAASLYAGGLGCGGRGCVAHAPSPRPYRVRRRESVAGLGPDMVTWLSVRKDDGLLNC
ncbi:hypothetical protein [Nonomuraea roseoviolacea]|uniref:Secreted protein n=1 Tax=Nonomuraea roseoviolacea subsp. carminata TaxID=160689 RepID=A0ABT1K3F6_9ACTN|nr:hypothetical protein [Nonomuraea roseoviolacea]MCP2348207.1 hypothetical protein [Nonomuraea roseoviolacea subsp. carminata]